MRGTPLLKENALQVENPHHPPNSLAEFLRQYAMIVLSILTALALERGAVAMHDAGAARASHARIEAELARNAADVVASVQKNTEAAKTIEAAYELLIDEMKQGKLDDGKLVGVVTPAFQHFGLSLPTWRRNAWDAAIADQSAGNLAQKDIERYSEIYATAQDIASATQIIFGGNWETQVTSLRVDIALHTINARTMANMLSLLLHASQQVLHLQTQLQDTLRNDGVAGAQP